MEKTLYKFLIEELKASLSEIEQQLRVLCLCVACSCAYNKEFGLDANYPKRHRVWFHAWIKMHFRRILLFHVKSTHGTNQNIMYSYSLAIHINHLPSIEFFEHAMSVPGKQHNILQKNLYVLLTSDEMIAQSFLLNIVYLYCMLPLWWLAENTHY